MFTDLAVLYRPAVNDFVVRHWSKIGGDSSDMKMRKELATYIESFPSLPNLYWWDARPIQVSVEDDTIYIKGIRANGDWYPDAFFRCHNTNKFPDTFTQEDCWMKDMTSGIYRWLRHIWNGWNYWKHGRNIRTTKLYASRYPGPMVWVDFRSIDDNGKILVDVSLDGLQGEFPVRVQFDSPLYMGLPFIGCPDDTEKILFNSIDEVITTYCYSGPSGVCIQSNEFLSSYVLEIHNPMIPFIEDMTVRRSKDTVVFEA